MIKKCLFANLLLIIFTAASFAQPTKSAEVIFLEGKVQSFDGQPITDYEISFESDSRIVETKTDNNGKYLVILPAEIYEIFTKTSIVKLNYKNDSYIPKEDFSYFRPYKRAKIDFTNIPNSKDSETRINLNLDIVLIESDSISYYGENQNINTGLFQKDRFNLTNKIKYETINPGQDENSLNVVIQYSYKKADKEESYYFTRINADFDSIFGKVFPSTVITYDKYTIYAEKVFYNEKKQKIRAENAMVIKIEEKKSEPLRVKNVIFDLTKEKVEIKFEK